MSAILLLLQLVFDKRTVDGCATFEIVTATMTRGGDDAMTTTDSGVHDDDG